jgi:hypothetical protein
MKTLFNSFIILFFFIVLSDPSFAQSSEIGKIFNNSIADQNFGSVILSQSMPVEQFENILAKCDDYVMFRFIGGKIVILNKDRSLVYPSEASFKDDEVFVLFSKSVIMALLSKGASESVSFEQRIKCFTVTSSNYTMEIGVLCPPVCNGNYSVF